MGNLFPATACEHLPDPEHLHFGTVVAQGQNVTRLDGLGQLDDFQDRLPAVVGQARIADGDRDRFGCAE